MTNSSHKVDQVATISAKRKTQSEQKVTSWKTTSITPVCLLTYILTLFHLYALFQRCHHSTYGTCKTTKQMNFQKIRSDYSQLFTKKLEVISYVVGIWLIFWDSFIITKNTKYVSHIVRHNYSHRVSYLQECYSNSDRKNKLRSVNFKRTFCYPQFFQKRTKKFDLTTMIPQVELFSFAFLEEFEDTKNTFRN